MDFKFNTIEAIAFDDNLIYLSNYNPQSDNNPLESIGTVIQNMVTYGYLPSPELFRFLQTTDLVKFNQTFVDLYHNVYGNPSNIIDGVVYKNFPTEVLDMSLAQYWVSQILMYMGVSKDNFTQVATHRPTSIDFDNLKVLDVIKNPVAYASDKFISLASSKSEWTEIEKQKINVLLPVFKLSDIAITNSLNLAYLASLIFMDTDNTDNTNHTTLAKLLDNWTNVLRMYAILSDNSPRLNVKFKYKSLPNSLRRKLLNLFENTLSNYSIDDVIRRKYQFLAAFKMLHVGQYKKRFPRTYQLVSSVRGGSDIKTTQSRIENEYDGYRLLINRPKEFIQSYNKLAAKVSESNLLNALCEVVLKLSITDLLFFVKYLKYYPALTQKVTLPKSNWQKFKIVPHTNNISIDLQEKSITIVEFELRQRLKIKFPNGINVSESQLLELDKIKLPKNKQDSSSVKYTTGTIFDIPSDIKTIRTCSYWTGNKTVWFDNSVLFINDTLDKVNGIAWNHTVLESSDFAIFSGDPVLGSSSSNGNATQLIDVNIDSIKSTYRYGLWNILCYSRVTFKEYHNRSNEYPKGLLQLLKNPNDGQLIEPSKTTMLLDLTSDSLNTYLMLFDFHNRTMMYIDLPLGGNTSSAMQNTDFVKTYIEAVLSYTKYIPSFADLVSYCDHNYVWNDNDKIPTLLYDDTLLTKNNESVHYMLYHKNANLNINYKSIYDFLSDYEM